MLLVRLFVTNKNREKKQTDGFFSREKSLELVEGYRARMRDFANANTTPLAGARTYLQSIYIVLICERNT